MADEQQQGAARRLLEHLEQRVGAGGIQLIDRVDDRDAPAALPGGRAEERHRAAHVIDLDVLAQIAGLFIDRALQHQEVALRLRGDAPRHRMRRRRRRATSRCAPAAPADRDGPGRNAPCDRPASPCRCRAGRRSARHAEGGRRDRRRAAPAPLPRGRTGRWFRAGAGARSASVSASLTTRCFRARPARSPDRAGR